MDVLVV